MRNIDNTTGENPFRWCYVTSSSQKSEAKPVANPAFPMLQANAQRAQGIADQPFTPYTGEMVAGATPNLSQSWDMFKDIGANNTGGATLDKAIGNVSSLNGGDLSGFMNPFQKNVTDATMADLERQRQIAGVNDQQKMQGAGAWGGSRSGVAQSLTNDAYDRNAASTLAGLNFGNFNNAQNMALQSGQALAGLSGQQLQQGLTRAGAVNQAGDQQRTLQQQQDDAALQEFMRRIGYPIQGQTLVNQSMGLLPGGVSNTQSGSGSSFGFTMPMPGK